MKEQNNRHKADGLSKEDVITAENVRHKGEYIAVCAVRIKLSFDCSPLAVTAYRNLARDIRNFDVDGYAVTDGYDIVQEAIVFLCGYIGRKLSDLIPDRKGEPITILLACIRAVHSYVGHNWYKVKKAVYLDELQEHQTAVSFDWDMEEPDYTSVNEKISAMELTARQEEVLLYRISGSSFRETARILSIARQSIQSLMRTVKAKYLKAFKDLPPMLLSR